MADRSHDWLAQADHALGSASVLRDAGNHGFACFFAQQAAEYAVKAAHLRHLQKPRGNVIRELLEGLPVVPETLVEKARVLDGYYIPTRYANGHDSGPPYEHYGPLQSEQAISYAREIVQFAHLQMAGPR